MFILSRIKKGYREKGKKLYMCFVDLEKAFDRVPTRVMEWAPRKKSIPEYFVKAVTSLNEGSKTKVWIPFQKKKKKDESQSKLPDDCNVGVGVHQVSVLSLLLFCNCG